MWQPRRACANTERAHATSGGTRAAAREARTHVREMRASALKGDAAGARQHAREAMPFVTTVLRETVAK